MRRPLVSLTTGLLLALSFSACRKDEIVTYRVAGDPGKTAPAAAPAAPSGMPASAPMAAPALSASDADKQMRNTAVTTADGPGLAWTAPATWTAGPERPMRKATLLLPGAEGATAELAVTAFPGDVGGNLANVNRWRQQLGLPPIGPAELGAALQHIDVGPLHIDVVELVGPSVPPAAPQRVIGAIVPYQGATWFFKVTGPDAVVAAERENFLGFVRTIRPNG
ncbi:MAG: hypothetical protein MUE42_12055 [Opitutaceae bacterium]|jgi:hypothetical protein|nr:hypothetical protein [Opitutaceae bacterium]